MAPQIYTGACLCGKIKYRVDLPGATPVPKVLICHCTHCKRYTSSAFSSNIVVPQSAHKFTAGTPKIFLDSNDFGTVLERQFCGDCGSPLTSKPAKLPGKIVVKYGTLDDRTAFVDTEAEIYIGRKESWLGEVLKNETNKFPGMHVD